MSLNCNEIDEILSELDLAGAFVQDVVQPSFDSIALYTYKPGAPKTVFVCLAAGACRLHEVRRKIPKYEKPLRFMELLRSHIKGARITACAQVGKERIVRLTLRKDAPVQVMPAAQERFAQRRGARAEMDDDENGASEYVLYIRLWSNAANIFLCGTDGIILDSFYRRPAKHEMTGNPFVLPEPKPSDKQWDVRDFADIQADFAKRHPDAEPLSFNQKVDAFYSQTAAAHSLESLLAQAEKWHTEHKSRQESALERLKAKRSAFLDAGQLKHQGDLILAFGHQLDGTAHFLECEDYESGKTVSITIDPKKNAQENAAAYYERYKKATHGLEDLEHDIARAEKSLAALEAQYEAMRAEKNPLKLEQLLRRTQKPKQQEKKAHPGLDYSVDGWYIMVGRDANENDELLRHHVRGQDMWLHTRDYSGGYVFIKARAGKTVPLEILLYAGNLAVYYSKAHKNGSADLYYTQVKHLRRAKNGPKGLVLPTHEKNLFVKLDPEKLRALEDMQQDRNAAAFA